MFSEGSNHSCWSGALVRCTLRVLCQSQGSKDTCIDLYILDQQPGCVYESDTHCIRVTSHRYVWATRMSNCPNVVESIPSSYHSGSSTSNTNHYSYRRVETESTPQPFLHPTSLPHGFQNPTLQTPPPLSLRPFPQPSPSTTDRSTSTTGSVHRSNVDP